MTQTSFKTTASAVSGGISVTFDAFPSGATATKTVWRLFRSETGTINTSSDTPLLRWSDTPWIGNIPVYTDLTGTEGKSYTYQFELQDLATGTWYEGTASAAVTCPAVTAAALAQSSDCSVALSSDGFPVITAKDGSSGLTGGSGFAFVQIYRSSSNGALSMMNDSNSIGYCQNFPFEDKTAPESVPLYYGFQVFDHITGKSFYSHSVLGPVTRNSSTPVGNSDSYSLTTASQTVAGGQVVTLRVTPDKGGPATDTVVTFSDNGAGGKFSPATVTLSAGSTAEEDVSYTVPAKGPVSVSCTNNTSLTDPTAIILTVSAAGALTLGTPQLQTLKAQNSEIQISCSVTGGIPPYTINVYRLLNSSSQGPVKATQMASGVTLPYIDNPPTGYWQYYIGVKDSSSGAAEQFSASSGGWGGNTIQATSSLLSEVTTETQLLLPDLAQQTLRFSVTGQLPTDQSATRTPTTGNIMKVIAGDTVLATVLCDLKIQGQTSAASPKHSYTVKFYNQSGAKLSLRFGSWRADNAFTLKGYQTDGTLIRDTLTCELWRDMHHAGAYPDNFIGDRAALGGTGAEYNQGISALFGIDGYPCSVDCNGAWQGVFVLRTKQNNADYLIDTSNSAHYWASYDHNLPQATSLNWGIFDPKS